MDQLSEKLQEKNNKKEKEHKQEKNPLPSKVNYILN